jgi:hypothetical protein
MPVLPNYENITINGACIWSINTKHCPNTSSWGVFLLHVPNAPEQCSRTAVNGVILEHCSSASLFHANGVRQNTVLDVRDVTPFAEHCSEYSISFHLHRTLFGVLLFWLHHLAQRTLRTCPWRYSIFTPFAEHCSEYSRQQKEYTLCDICRMW